MAERRPLVLDSGNRVSELPQGDTLPQQAGHIPRETIEGLRLKWVSFYEVQVSTGGAYVPSVGGIVTLSATASIDLFWTASTWYHLYLLSDGSVEAATTSPSVPYFGTAKTKRFVTSTRYLGSILILSDGTIAPFLHVGDRIIYLVGQSTAPFRVLANGTATAATNVVLAGAVPPTAVSASVRAQSTASAGPTVSLFTSQVATTSVVVLPTPSTTFLGDLAMYGGYIRYLYGAAPSAGGLYIDVLGYVFER